ncbi:MAG: PH domain-containing protein [Pyrinomonas methylaliphatogenes]|nr:PH domain-containing protein [Pyrinomonas methylaliphatogenes]
MQRRTVYCESCGSAIFNEARFCGHCGAAIGANPPVRSASRKLAASESKIIFITHPAALPIGIGYIFSGLLALAITAAFAYIGLPFKAALLTSVLVMLPVVLRHLRRNMTIYKLTDSAIEVNEGLFIRRRRVIPLRSISQVTISQSIGEWLLGIGDVIVENAEDRSRAIALRKISRPRDLAEMILREQRHWR